MRLVVVLGYSTRRGDALHPICAERLAAAEGVAENTDAVLLSGWSRRRHRPSEAELMHGAWRGPAVHLVADGDSRTTVGNVRALARTARELGVDEVVLVTSSWHARRARLLARAALGPDVTVTLATTQSGRPAGLVAREVACLLPAYATVSASRALAVWRRFSASSQTALRGP
jgi:hypothetical protein